MSMKRSATILFSLFLIASAVGCATRPAPAPTPQGYRTTPNNIVRTAEKSVMPPKQLASLLSNAEGIITDADSKNWAGVQSRIARMKTSHGQLKPLMQASMVPSHTMNSLSNAISGLEKQAAAKNVYETKFEANRLTKVLPDVASMYKMVVPADIGKLGYLGREIDLNAEKGDWKSAKTNYDSARTMWSGLSKQLGTTYKTDVGSFTTNLDNVGKAITDKSVSRVKADTKKLSDSLAVIESDFTKQGFAK